MPFHAFVGRRAKKRFRRCRIFIWARFSGSSDWRRMRSPRGSRRLDSVRHSSPPRLALSEAAMERGDFANARRLAETALSLSQAVPRARATALAAAAAQGDGAALADAVLTLAGDPSIRTSPPLAGAVAVALEQSDAGTVVDAVAALAPFALELPPRLLAAIAERGAALPPALAQRRWSLADNDALRRIAVAAYARDPKLAASPRPRLLRACLSAGTAPRAAALAPADRRCCAAPRVAVSGRRCACLGAVGCNAGRLRGVGPHAH